MQITQAMYQAIFNEIVMDGGEEFINAMARCAIQHSADHVAEVCSIDGNEEFEFSKGAVLDMAVNVIDNEFNLEQAIVTAIRTIPVEIKKTVSATVAFEE